MSCNTQNQYLVGNVARLSVLFNNLSNQPTDPTTVTLIVKDPAGVMTTYTTGITRTGTGAYYYDLTLDQVGIYYWYFQGTGLLIAAGQRSLQVLNSPVFETP